MQETWFLQWQQYSIQINSHIYWNFIFRSGNIGWKSPQILIFSAAIGNNVFYTLSPSMCIFPGVGTCCFHSYISVIVLDLPQGIWVWHKHIPLEEGQRPWSKYRDGNNKFQRREKCTWKERRCRKHWFPIAAEKIRIWGDFQSIFPNRKMKFQ